MVHRRDEANVEADLGVVEVGASEHDRVRVVDLLHIKSVCDSLGSMSITQPYIGSTHIDDKKNSFLSSHTLSTFLRFFFIIRVFILQLCFQHTLLIK